MGCSISSLVRNRRIALAIRPFVELFGAFLRDVADVAKAVVPIVRTIDNRLTKSDNRLMRNGKHHLGELVRIVDGALRLDLDKVRNYTAFLAEKLEAAGESAAARRLRRLLKETENQLRPVDVGHAIHLPVDSESRFPLVEPVDVEDEAEPPIVLEPEAWDVVREFLSVAKSFGQAEAQGVDGPLSFLVCGPPGTGKSRLARYISRELELPLFLARLDGLISSYVGSTSKNIRAIFEFAASTPGVLFLDEFDAIAKVRGDSNEMGELKRVVNSFIQNLDLLGSHSVVIAATNHDELLDSAVWRRFSYRLILNLPSAESRKQLWLQYLDPIELSTRDIQVLVDLSDGFTGSDIAEVCRRMRRRQFATKHPPAVSDAFRILTNLSIGKPRDSAFLSEFSSMDEQAGVRALRNRNSSLYSHAAIADLFGVSKATAHRWSK